VRVRERDGDGDGDGEDDDDEVLWNDIYEIRMYRIWGLESIIYFIYTLYKLINK
jgi:hypothetical protein